jgi:hypothetical protein
MKQTLGSDERFKFMNKDEIDMIDRTVNIVLRKLELVEIQLHKKIGGRYKYSVDELSKSEYLNDCEALMKTLSSQVENLRNLGKLSSADLDYYNQRIDEARSKIDSMEVSIQKRQPTLLDHFEGSFQSLKNILQNILPFLNFITVTIPAIKNLLPPGKNGKS